jgi:hypothetical protein
MEINEDDLANGVSEELKMMNSYFAKWHYLLPQPVIGHHNQKFIIVQPHKYYG